VDGNKQEYERCPLCESWNFHLTNIFLNKTDDGVYLVEYVSPSLGLTLFSSEDNAEAQRVLNRMLNLKWDVFKSVISDNPAYEARLYLCGEPCLMNGFYIKDIILSSKLIMAGQTLYIYGVDDTEVITGFNDETPEEYPITLRDDGRRQFRKEGMTFILDGIHVADVIIE